MLRFLPLTLFALALPAASQSRTITPLDTAWRFQQADAKQAAAPSFDDSSWTPVQLPHDWSIAGPVDPNAPAGQGGGFFPTGIAWYRRTIAINKPEQHRRTWIAFDGVMANSDVFCNGTLLGHRPYGYISFHYDLTSCLHPGANTLAVRTDTSQQPASRWYAGSGINRHVRLISTSDVHIAPWGTFVTTPQVSADSATVHVRATVANDSDAATTVSLNVQVLRPGKQSSTASAKSPQQSIPPHSSADLDAELTLDHPDRWDMNHPAMHTVHASVLVGSKRITDEETVPFGIREFHFDPNQGFFLNGVHHKLYGAAMHTDAGAFGTAVPLAAWARRLTALRALGVNAIRTSHNPPAPEFLDLCDRMGFLVMDEMFDAWTVAKNPYDYHLYFKEWSLRDTADTVQRDRNHPSIILYSAGNEIHDTPKPDIAIPILKSLVDTFHKNDSTRPVTQALFRPNVSHDYDNGLADLLDVIGQNYREQEILAAHAQKPTRAIVGTENTHVREQWVAMRDHPEYSGQFLWTGVDYLGEAGHWPSIGSGSGLILTTALPRARAFERQSWWTETPMVQVARRVAPVQRNPTDPGYEAPNQPTATRFSQPLLLNWTPANLAPHPEDLEVYTNAEEVELTLNGESLGVQKRHPDASPIRLQITFHPGTLKAIARTAGKVVAESTLRTAGPPARLVLTSSGPFDPPSASTALTPAWDDIAYVHAILVDAQGTTVPDSTRRVQFSVSGPGAIIAVDNGNMLDHDPFQAKDRTLYEGSTFGLVRATAPGSIVINASSPDVASASLTIHAAPAATEQVVRSF
jgi:beta-galactosidase